MYSILKFIENVIRFIRIKIKILYWKLKYGKRIKIGKKFRFRKGMIINISNDAYLEIGDNNFFNNYCSINCRSNIKIGNNNMFGENVKFYDHNHVFNDKNVDMMHTFKKGNIIIGNDNWIASNVTMLAKSEVGNRNVVSANTVLNEIYENETLIKETGKKNVEKIKYKLKKQEEGRKFEKKSIDYYNGI